jgi:hypothetical protein
MMKAAGKPVRGLAICTASTAVDAVQIARPRTGLPAAFIIETVASSEALVRSEAFTLVLKVYYIPRWTSASE